jgi:ankyrin repeat protein
MQYLTIDYWKDLAADIDFSDEETRRSAIKVGAAGALLALALIISFRAAGAGRPGQMHDIFAALSLEDVNAVREALESDDDAVHATDVEGNTPLHVAASYGSAPIVAALLDNGADADARNRSGLTPLAMAVREASKPVDVVQVLLARGARPDVSLPEGQTLLHVAARTPNLDPRVITLLAGSRTAPASTQLAARDASGRTPLELAVQNGDAKAAAAFRRIADGAASASARQ